MTYGKVCLIFSLLGIQKAQSARNQFYHTPRLGITMESLHYTILSGNIFSFVLIPNISSFKWYVYLNYI